MRRFPAATTRPVVAGAAAWALSIAFFVGQAVVQAASARPYSLATNLISDLGDTACGPAICSPLHGLMGGTFVAVGLLHAIGAIATWPAWPRPALARPGLVLLALAGTGLVVAGLAPENVAPGVHALGALSGLVCLNVGVALLGLALLDAARPLGAVALAAGAVGLAGTAAFLGAPGGAIERVADYPAAVVIIVLGAFLLARAAAGGAR